MSNMELKDKYVVNDTKDFSTSSKRPQTSYYTEIDVRNELGELLFRRHNVILLSGRRFTLEKIFNVTPDPSSILTLDQILAERPNITSGVRYQPKYDIEWTTNNGEGPIRYQCVCLFGVGNGGAGLELGDVANPTARECNLYNIVPMRYVKDSTSDEEIKASNKYFMRMKDEDGGIGFYLKKIENTTIKIIDGSGAKYEPKDSYNTSPYLSNETSYALTDDVDAYVEMQLKIDTDDIREWFEENEKIPYINELALYIGYQDPSIPSNGEEDYWVDDYYGVEAFSKLTFNNEALVEESKELNIVYRIYI